MHTTTNYDRWKTAYPPEWDEEVTSECCGVELVDDEKGNNVCKYCGQECDENGVVFTNEPDEETTDDIRPYAIPGRVATLAEIGIAALVSLGLFMLALGGSIAMKAWEALWK